MVDIETLDEDRLRINTLESWRFSVLWVTGEGDAEPPRVQALAGSYLLARGATGWRVESWASDEPGREEAESTS